MGDTNSHISFYNRKPLHQLIISLLIIVSVGSLLFIILLIPGVILFNPDLHLIDNPSAALTKNDFSFVRYMLIIQDISLFIVPGIIILKKLKTVHQTGHVSFKFPHLTEVALVAFLAFCIFPVTSFTGQLNSGMNLPDWLSGVENWMKEKEELANRLIGMVIVSDTFSGMMLNLLMIAVLPAIGEELIFRGVLQKIFCNLFKSGHIAVWTAAFIFSAIHFQFYGFVPRFLMGLVFGYLFLWSGTLWMPVLSHFFNNAVAVLAVYTGGWTELNQMAEIPWWKQLIALPVPLITGIIILIYFRNKSRKNTETSVNQPLITDKKD